jgi:hypothetical protein
MYPAVPIAHARRVEIGLRQLKYWDRCVVGVAHPEGADDHLIGIGILHRRMRADAARTIMEQGISTGWPIVLSSLKTLLETGEAMPSIWTREGSDWKRLWFREAT